MILRPFLHTDPVAISYLFGCGGKAVGAVVDPVGEIAPYLRAAQETGMRIHYVIDTHIHADHVSAGQRLAEAAGGEYVLFAGAAGETRMKALFILNDPPYGTERCYNGLRLANALVKSDAAAEVTVFLMADAVACGKKGQKTPEGYYSLERMLKRFTIGTHRVLLCGTCLDARGLTDAE